MALYDDDDSDSPARIPIPVEVAAPTPPTVNEEEREREKKERDGARDISMKFLQAQLSQRRNAPSTMMRNIVTPVIDLAARNKSNINMKRIQPVKAIPISDAAPLSFLPKAATEENIMMFGEVVIKNEYQPSVPNDFMAAKKRKEERELKEKIAKEVADRLARDHKDEARKREKGAAIAPPQILLEDSAPHVEQKASQTTSFTPPSFLPAFGKGTTRGLGVAANIMSKYGYKEGSGLGANEQGISTALSVERKGRNVGAIVDSSSNASSDKVDSFATPSMPMKPMNTANIMSNASKILLLRNVVTPDELDPDLEEEMKEEMSKYGQVLSIYVHKMEGAPATEAVRIFVEFTNAAQAIKACVVMNGRFFGGRQVLGNFYNYDDFSSKLFDKPV